MKKSKNPLPKSALWYLPEIDESNPLSLPVYEVLRIQFEKIKTKILMPLAFEKKVDALYDDIIAANPEFHIALKKVKKTTDENEVLQSCFLKEIHLRLDKSFNDLKVKLNKSRAKHSAQFSIYTKKLPQIDHDIFFKCLQSNGWLDEVMYDSEARRIKEIEDLPEALSPCHSRLKVLERLQPNSPLFTLGLMELELSGSQGAWTKTKIQISRQALGENMGSQFKFLDSSTCCEVFSPEETLTQVILPEKTKTQITSLCQQYLNPAQGHQKGRLTFLFKGPAGTGKSMTAKAIANALGMKVLRVDFPDVSNQAIPKTIAFFAERARAAHCILLFDECEDLIGNNWFTGKSDGWVKQFFETFTGVAVFTTNYGAPAGFERRMSLSLDFKSPDARIRTEILKTELSHLAGVRGIQSLPGENVLTDFAGRYAISGGYYQQILQLAAAQSSPGTIEVNALREAFQHYESQIGCPAEDSVREPKVSLASVRLDSDHKTEIRNFVEYSKEVLAGAMVDALMPQGATALFSGPSGTGKTITAEAVARELGIRFRRVSPSTFLSKWVGETEEEIKRVFKDAERERYLLFIDEAEGLFLDRTGASKSWEKTQADELLQQVEAFKGVLIIATNFKDMLDPAFARRFLFHVPFTMPSVRVREELWSAWRESLILTEDCISELARGFELTGGEIRNVAVRAKVSKRTKNDELAALCDEVLRGRTGQPGRRIGV